MLNVIIKLVQHDSFKRFGVRNKIIFVIIIGYTARKCNKSVSSNYAASITYSLH